MRPGGGRVQRDSSASIRALGLIVMVVVGAAVAAWIWAHIVVISILVGVALAVTTLVMVMLALRMRRHAAVLAAELEARRLARLEASRPARHIWVTQTDGCDIHIHFQG
jgi:fatty acid desaturase